MTLYYLARATTVTSANPVVVVTPAPQLAGILLLPVGLQIEVKGTSGTCTAAGQWVGSFDNPQTLSPQGTGGQWINIGTATTVTASPAELGTGGATTITSGNPYVSYGFIVQTLSGTGAQVTAVMQA